MQITSAEAAKLLRKLNEELQSLNTREELSREFTISVGEKEEELRPDYDYAKVQAEILSLEEKIRDLKHAVNQFNVSTQVPDFGLTIDQMLIYIPQLSARKQKLAGMKDRLPRTRQARYNTNLVEYVLVNYDLEQVKKDYDAVAEELSRAQNALDLVNNTIKFEVED